MNTVAPTTLATGQPRVSRRLLVWPLIVALAVVAMLWGATTAMSDTRRLIELVYSITFAILITLACRNDGRNRGTPALPIFQVLMLFTWPIAVPVYLIWTRKLLGVLLTILFVVGFLLLYYVPAIAVYVMRTQP